MKTEHTHAWETIQRCFECGEERDWGPEDEPVASAPCPRDPIEEAERNHVIQTVAALDWRGKDEALKRVIFLSRKLAGWTRSSWQS